MRNISSFAGLLKMHFKDHIDPNSEQYFSFIDKSTQQMKQLIEDILDYSKTNNLKLQKEELDLNEIVDEISKQIKLNRGDKNVEIHSTKLPIIKSDRTRVHQLFQNLIENGLKYNESKIPTVTVLCRNRKDLCYLIIEDNGIGIDTKYKDQIFNAFERLHTRDKYPGTGIGLATCKKIVHTLEGEIWVESVVGKGSQFHITFPKKFEIEKEEIILEKEEALEPA